MEFFENMLNNISTSAGDFLPGTIGALLILIIGWLIAKFLKRIISKVISRTGVDEKLGSDKIKLSSFIAKLVYLLVMIFVFMLTLEKLGMQSVLDPVKNLLDSFLTFIPNLVGAGLVGYIGYMLATIVSQLIGFSGDTISKISPKLKLSGDFDFVSILKKIVFIFIFIPMLIAALNILNMDAISVPATAMLSQFFAAIPKILVATIIIILFFVGGRFVSQLLKDLVESLKLDKIIGDLNLGGFGTKINLSKIISNIAFFFILIFGIMTAVEKLEFTQLTEVMNSLLHVSGNIIFGLVILIVGNWVSYLAATSFASSNGNKFIKSIIRISVLSIFLAMGLKAMGMGDEIINLAFGITLGTLAVTIALSFGLGGREAAGKQMGKILNKFNDDKS